MIREIQPSDNTKLAEVIRAVLTEYGADPKTTVLGDPTLNDMYIYYQFPCAVYYVVEENGEILGGCGIKQLDGSIENICELQRMYLASTARGKGYGKALMDLCLKKAKEFKYDKIYLESLNQLHTAIALYEKTGFKRIPAPLGNTGHGGCDVLMILDLV